MNLKINENLLNKFDKKMKYPNLIIKRKEIKIKNKDTTTSSMDVTPLAFSFSLDQKTGKLINKNNFMNSYFNKNKYNSKLIRQYRNMYNKRNDGNLKNKFFHKATSSNESIDMSINKERKNNTALIKSFNNTKDNNFLFIHKKIFVLDKISNTKPTNTYLNSQKKNRIKSLTNSTSSKKYQTIFTKCIMKDIKLKEKSSELAQNFQPLSSKYNNKIEESKETQTPRKMFTNEELKKTVFRNNDMYLKTDSTVNYNHTLSVMLPKFVHIPNFENLKNFKNNNKPIFYCQKDDVKQKIDLMIQNSKNNNENNMFLSSNERFKNKNKNNDKKAFLEKMLAKNNLKTNGIKFVSVNLNHLTKIPNRVVQFDRYGNQIRHFMSKSNRKRIFSQSDAFQLMKKNMINKFILIKNKRDNGNFI